MMNESDVEQKFIIEFLTNNSPEGLDYFHCDIQTKPDIRKLTIDKGKAQKLYYPDYVIVLDGLPVMVIEAKEPNDDNLQEAYREARLYAGELNSFYPSQINPCLKVMSTNGFRLLAGFSDKKTPEINIDLLNRSVSNADYINLLEFSGRDTLHQYASKVRSTQKGKTKYLKPVFMLGGVSVMNEMVGENDFGSNISLEYKNLFNPETSEEKADIVKNAYITSKRRESHIARIDRVLRATIPPHQRNSRVLVDSEYPQEIIENFNNKEDRDKLKNEIFLLVGSVGSGKSTFTEFLKLEALPDPIKEATRWININLNSVPLSKDDIYNWIIDEIIKFIKSMHSSIDFDDLNFLKELYKKELSAVSKGRAALFPEDSTEHLLIISEELKKSQEDKIKTLKNLIDMFFEKNGILLVIVLDNCDKRTRDDQLLMFEVAGWMKNTFCCLVFLPIRDTTYDLYSNVPPLDTVVKDLVFRIEAPLLERVLQARLSYLLRMVEKNNTPFTYRTNNGMYFSCNRNEVANFIQSIITTIFQDKHLKSIIKGLAGRNIRQGLEIVLDFCKSGHISADQITKMKFSNGDYRIPLHIAYRVLLKGNRKYFNDEKFRLINLFHSVIKDDLPDPFVRIDILGWLKDKFGEKGPNNTPGYHKVEKLIQDMQGIGHARSRTFEEIQKLIFSELIQTEGLTKDVNDSDLIIITASGFTQLEIMKNINYLSIVSEDTFFRDHSVAKRISDNLVGRGLIAHGSKEAALDNSILLIDYLQDFSQEHFLDNFSKSKKSLWTHQHRINDIKIYLNSKESQSEKLSMIRRIENEYKKGTQHRGEVVSVQIYGIFVEFELGISCLVHYSNLGEFKNDFSEHIEEGDEVYIEILEYNTQKKRLNGRLITHLH